MGLIGGLLIASSAARSDGLGDPGEPPQEICGLCHGLDGVSRMSRFPRLAGQKAAYIEKQLGDFRAGRRANDGGQMAAIVTEINDSQVKQVARYFSSLPPPPPAQNEESKAERDEASRLFKDGDEDVAFRPA